MGLFGNINDGKKNWTDVIKNESPADCIIWKHTNEDFNTNSTLLVMPGEEAIFVNQGRIEQIFQSGTHKLSTSNYPFITRLRNMFSGGVSVFNCVVFFVRKTQITEIKWGTDSPIQVRDKLLGIATKLRARGSYRIQIDNPGVFLETLFGNSQYMTSDNFRTAFVSQFQSKIKSAIAKELMKGEFELLGIDARIDEFSEILFPQISAILAQNGVRCVNFAISAIDIEGGNILREKYDQIGMDQIAQIRAAQAQKAALDTLGINWGQQQSADILKTMASNPGNLAAGAAAGLGVGIAAGKAMGEMASNMLGTQNISVGSPVPPPPPSASQDPVEKLSKLKKMLEAGLIEQAEYDAKKKSILDTI